MAVMRSPITMLVLKVASGCNLDCDYCYEYRMGDESWRHKPHRLSIETGALIGRRIREHCEAWGRFNFFISFHGGEPLLAGIQHLSALTEVIPSGFLRMQVAWR